MEERAIKDGTNDRRKRKGRKEGKRADIRNIIKDLCEYKEKVYPES